MDAAAVAAAGAAWNMSLARFAFGPLQGKLEGLGSILEKEVRFMHIFTFLEYAHAHELAIYPRLDGYRGIGFHAANGPHLDRDCPF